MIDIETRIRRALGPVGRWTPKGRRWWFRWWMYPPDHRRRMIGTGSSWEFRVSMWIDGVLARIIPGRCTQCPGRNHTHKMNCPKLRHGVKGKRLWSQDG